MTKDYLKRILSIHSVPFYEQGGKIFVDSMIGGTALFEKVENVTTWNKKKLLNWLGY